MIAESLQSTFVFGKNSKKAKKFFLKSKYLIVLLRFRKELFSTLMKLIYSTTLSSNQFEVTWEA